MNYIKLIKNGESFEKQLKDTLIYIYRKNYIKETPQILDLRKKKDKEQLIVYANNFLKAKLICKIKLYERGWTEDLINTYLLYPDKTEINPTNRRRLDLYSLCKVESLEGLEEIKSSLVHISNSTLQKSQLVYQFIDELNIVVPQLSLTKLLELSINKYNNSISKSNAERKSLYTKAHTLESLCFNYLRHECTQYDKYLKQLNNTDNGELGYDRIKQYINQKIKEAYPNLKSHIYQYQKNNGYIVNQNINKRA
jgi:hypothetical protein